MKPIRRNDGEKDAQWALEILDKALYITVSMITSDGMSYAVQLSLIRKDDNTFYFHCS